MKNIDEANYFEKRVIVLTGKLGKIIPVIKEINRFNIYLDYLIYDKNTLVIQGKTQGIIDTLYKRLRQYEIKYSILLDKTNEYLYDNINNGVIQYTIQVPIKRKGDLYSLLEAKNWISINKKEKVNVKYW